MNVELLFQESWVLDPTTEPEPVKASMALRPDTLDGKVLGILDNGKPNAKRLLDLVGELVTERYNLAGVVKRQKLDATKEAPQEMLDEMAEECNIAIVGVGD